VDARFGRRRRGFHFWTTKKNFFSFHCFNESIKIRPITSVDDGYTRFYDIFCHVLDKIRQENDEEGMTVIRSIAHRAGNLTEYPRLLDFLYSQKISIEDYFVATGFDKTCSTEHLFHVAIRTFSTFHEVIDEWNSHASKIYSVKEAFPRWSLGAHGVLSRYWDAFLSYGRFRRMISVYPDSIAPHS